MVKLRNACLKRKRGNRHGRRATISRPPATPEKVALEEVPQALCDTLSDPEQRRRKQKSTYANKSYGR